MLEGKVRTGEVRIQPGLGHAWPDKLIPYYSWWLGVQEGLRLPRPPEVHEAQAQDLHRAGDHRVCVKHHEQCNRGRGHADIVGQCGPGQQAPDEPPPFFVHPAMLQPSRNVTRSAKQKCHQMR